MKKVFWCPNCNKVTNEHNIKFNVSNTATTVDDGIIVKPMKLSIENMVYLFDIKYRSCNEDMVVLDYDIHNIIIELNNKEYHTYYSCSGHDDIIPYISLANTDDERTINLKHLVNTFNESFGSLVLAIEVMGHMFIIRCHNRDITYKAFQYIADNALPQYTE